MEPLSVFLWRYNSIRFVRSPNSAGMEPVSAFSWSHKLCRFVRLPNSAGMEPVRLLPLASRPVTRGRVPLTVMPSHEVMARFSAQFRVPVPSVSLSPSNVVQSATKPATSGVPVTAPVTATLLVVQVVWASAPSGNARKISTRTLARRPRAQGRIIPYL